MANPFSSKLSEKTKDTILLMAGFCGIITLLTGIMIMCKWYENTFIYLIAPMILTLVMVVPIVASKKIKKSPVAFRSMILLFNTIIVYYFVESITGLMAPTRFFCWQLIIGLILTYSVYLIIGSISGNMKFTLIFSNIFFATICISNKVISDIRGRPLFISDFASFRTAMNVSSSYNIPILKYVSYFIVFALITVFSILLIQRYCSSANKVSHKNRFIWTVLITLVLYVSYGTDLYKNAGIKLTYWSHQNGILLDWLMESKDFRVTPPEGYSTDSIMAAAETYKTESESDEYNGIKPDIIVIMNESFSDLKDFMNFNTDIDYMPFLHSVEAGEHPDMITGKMYTSVYGGNTANSEYEFLTGDSIILYPQCSVPYQTFLNGKGKISGLTSQLKDMGYSAVAMHPYWASGWNRRNIYSYMGFDEQYYLDDMVNMDYIRSYCSDACNYRNVIDLYEKRDKTKPFFLFNVTMQNHGGYTYEDYESTVHLTDYPGQFPKTEQYLSLVRESDMALVDLITYFRSVEKPTIIIFFGDHQPSVENEFYQALCNKPFDEFTSMEGLRMYITKYMVWKNFDTESFHIGDTSLNYFSAQVLDMIGMPTTPYQNYLLGLREEYPIVSTDGILDAEGNYIAVEDADFISFYKTIVYNHMIDNEDYKQEFFEGTYEINNDYLIEDY